MSIIAPILAELDHESRTTVRVLERVPQDRLEWTPHAKSTPIGKLAWHIATVPMRVQAMIGAGAYDLAANPAPPRPDDVASIVSAYQANVAGVREYMATLDDDAVKEKFTMLRNGEPVMTMSKIALIRNILLNHTYHHRGQLSVYLRLLDVPVPSIYGPSADEKA